jgi:iron complex transport system substrate-binding protein
MDAVAIGVWRFAVWCGVFAMAMSSHALAAPRVVSLDMCADQYVLGLVPRDRVAAVSMRAQLQESFYRDRAKGLRRVPGKSEAVLALAPDIVVRTWGGDRKLLDRLAKSGIKVITINDLQNLDQAEGELLRVGTELGQPQAARAEAQRFRAAMDAVRPIGLGRTVLYYTPGGYTAGPDTFIGDFLTRLSFRMESQTKGFYFLSPEVLLSLKPDVFALGFYDDAYAMRRVPGRHPLVRKAIEKTPHFTMPATAIACSAWYAAYDLRALSQTTIR